MAEYRTDEYRTAFRATLHPDYEDISDEQADALLESVTQSMSPQETDAYMEGLGSWLKSATHSIAQTAPVWAPIAGAAIGSIVPGVGTAIGGAVGGLAGNVTGRLAASPRASGGAIASAALQGAAAGGSGAARGRAASPAGGLASAATGLIGAALGGSTRPAASSASTRSGSSGSGSSGSGSSGSGSSGSGSSGSGSSGSGSSGSGSSARPAATQLMGLLNSPHLSRAVLGQVNGAVGRPAVPIRAGGQSHEVSFGSFMNALLQLAQRAITEARAWEAGAGSTSYLTDSEGHYAYDPASPEQRTDGLLALLQQESEESAARDESEDRYAEAAGPAYDSLTEWFLDSGLIRH